MGWSTNGYTPETFDTIINQYYQTFVSQYGSFTFERFRGSREYELFYSAAQIEMQYQAIFAEIFSQVSEWFIETSEKINAPSTVPAAIIQKFKDDLSLDVAVKPMELADAGMAHIAIDYTPSPELNVKIAELLATECIAAGVVTVGDIDQDYSTTEGQPFTYSWTQSIEKPVKFRIEIFVSRGSSQFLESTTDIRQRFLDNYESFYRIGKDIEPEVYFEINRDAPYASNIITEYSVNGGIDWFIAPFQTIYTDKYIAELDLADVTVTRP